jgi:hypothetical protein
MRTITITLTTALAALALAACGGETAGTGASSSEDRAFEGALKFARCMRGEGIDFPDPRKQTNGLVRVGGPGQNPNDPRTRAAAEKCGKHLERGGGEAPDPAQQAKFQDAFVKYARCMRAEGVDVPDPKPGQGVLVLRAGDTSAPNPESPRFQAADRTCHHHLAELDKSVQKTQEGR